ncbi:helix-turn-helix transcriptional regulator [Corynebacterium sp. H127]|uniref:helix-turn-helix domain-containing protein n=1 Tax=Corynebacterium sp. H127 TaxID=3133418 RepID=UPI0030A1E058
MSNEDKRRAPEPEWLLAITTDSRRQIAECVGVSHAQLGRQLNGDTKLTADLVLSIAHGYNTDPIQALHQAGKLTNADMAQYRGTNTSLSTATSKALLQELLRREPVA